MASREYEDSNEHTEFGKRSVDEMNGGTQEESFKKRGAGVDHYGSVNEDPNQDNLAMGSLASTIMPRTNNCSGFNETFDNILAEKSQDDHGKRNINDIYASGDYSSKNYDMPLA